MCRVLADHERIFRAVFEPPTDPVWCAMRTILMIVVLAVVTAGCGESPARQTGISTTDRMPASESSATAVTSSAPPSTTTTATSCRGCWEPPDIPAAEALSPGWAEFVLAPGTYTTSVFELPMSFTVDQQIATFGDSSSWLFLSFSLGQHSIAFWGPSLLADINPVEWIQNQAATRDSVQILAVEQTTLFGRLTTQIDVSNIDNWYPEFAAEGQRFEGRIRFLVAEIDDRPLLVTVNGLSCTPWPMCTPDDEDANQYQFEKYLRATERLLASVRFDG
jgi:hypothetical protein